MPFEQSMACLNPICNENGLFFGNTLQIPVKHIDFCCLYSQEIVGTLADICKDGAVRATVAPLAERI